MRDRKQNRRKFRSSQVQKQANFKMHMGSSLFTSLCPVCLVVSLHNPTVLNWGGMMALVAFFSLLFHVCLKLTLVKWDRNGTRDLETAKLRGIDVTGAKNHPLKGLCIKVGWGQGDRDIRTHVWGLVYLPTLTPAGWKLLSHADSRLLANFSRLIEKCELLSSCLTQFPKIC